MNCSFYLAIIIAAAAVFLGVLSLFFFLRKFKIKKKDGPMFCRHCEDKCLSLSTK